MEERIAALLDDATVRRELRRAWEESEPGVVGGHEEGGFICQDSDGNFVIDRWPSGGKNGIYIPPHPSGQRNGEVIVATFHTHPNTGNTYFSEPSDADCELVSTDPELRTIHYLGEFVIAKTSFYWISPQGDYITVGDTEAVLAVLSEGAKDE
jgi:proteasome lid subunit RPN8/RPN11